MNKFRFTTKLFVIATFLLAFASIAQAQATRTWVSGVGDDVNPCSRTAPCKTYAGAISKTATNGEISTLDPGGFGAVTITKSITIEGTQGQGYGSILASGTTGVIINLTASPDAQKTVRLRNLAINGTGSGTRSGIRGINVSSANATAVHVLVENCYINDFVNEGILFSGPGGTLTVNNTTIYNNGTAGIRITTTGEVKTTLEGVKATRNQNGIHASSSSRTIANNCVFSNNTTNGVFADATTGFATIRVWNSIISNNGANGVRAGNAGGGSSGVEIGQNQINQNVSNGVLIGTGGAVDTFGNNSIRGNGTDGCTGCTPAGPGS